MKGFSLMNAAKVVLYLALIGGVVVVAQMVITKTGAKL
jgi:hypothetical protein